MDRKSLLTKYVKAALVRLRFEQAIYTLQTGLCMAILFALLVVAASRLFVLPYYGRIAWLVAVLAVVATIIFIIYKRLRKSGAIYRLDRYMPDNLLITALDEKIGETHLASAIIEAAESKVVTAFEGFKKRDKHYVNVKMLTAIAIASSCLAVLLIFPSEAQLEAGAIVKEKEVIEEVKKEVKELIKKEALPEVKKELQDLAEKLLTAELSEDVLKELVKKQKELRLKEQRLADKQEAASRSDNPAEALTEAEEQELKELGKLTDKLAQHVGKAHSELNKIGKAPTLPALAGASGTSTVTGGKPSDTSGEGQGEATGEKDGQSQEENDEQESDGEKGEGTGQESGSGQVQGSGQGAGSGSGSGPGQGSGSGQGTGQGLGSGTGGTGAGQGSGGRNLLSVPYDRVGEKGDPSVVGGNLGKGDFIEEYETQGPVGTGTIRPYQEVVGDYKDSYLKSTEKLQLPPDLQQILSDYFSSIE
ncbi:hypothetical protein [Sporosarcina sp. YIM B06819]|uniref:hypothetical protein n=1 Tax=Sporosarcina sp. YIM B06819 TaxID=3081769 RepID=UPI00298BF9E4|nr:hypothetical protein [Sporosarcina sp. YIM B06819]